MKKLFLYLACLAVTNLYAAPIITGYRFVNLNGNNMDYSIERYNRINFGIDCFTLYSSTDATLTPIEIEYNDCSSMVFINDASGIENIANDCQNAEIIVANKLIYVDNVANGNDYTIVVYSCAGEMIAKSLHSVDASRLSPNTYIIVAYNNHVVITRKIII